MSDSLWPYGQQPTRLLRPQDSLGKHTGVGFHFLLQTNPEEIWYTDEISFVLDGKRRAGYAVVPNFEALEAKPLPPGSSAQLAELIALTRALELGKGKIVAIYTDSKYAFLELHAHAAICKKEATWLPEGPQSNMVIILLGSWRQSICPLRFQSPTVKDA